MSDVVAAAELDAECVFAEQVLEVQKELEGPDVDDELELVVVLRDGLVECGVDVVDVLPAVEGELDLDVLLEREVADDEVPDELAAAGVHAEGLDADVLAVHEVPDAVVAEHDVRVDDVGGADVPLVVAVQWRDTRGSGGSRGSQGLCWGEWAHWGECVVSDSGAWTDESARV